MYCLKLSIAWLQGKKNIKIDIQAIESDQTNERVNDSLMKDFANQFAEECRRRAPPIRSVPSISISVETDFEPMTRVEPMKRPTNLVIPTLMIQTPSPTQEIKTPPVLQVNACPGSPPPQSANKCTTEANFTLPSNKAHPKK